MDLNTKLIHTSGIGPSLQAKLDKLNLTTIEDLITHYPFRYEDFAKISKIRDGKVGEINTFLGEIWSIKNTYTKSHKILTKAILGDDSGVVEIIWFNNRWIIKNIKVGDKIQTSGKLDYFAGKLSLVAPEWEKVADEALHTGRLVPVYPETYGLTSKWIRAKIHQMLPLATNSLEDPIPESATKDFLPLKEALNKIHFPDSYTDILQAKKRLSFDELFYIQLSTLKKREDWQNKQVTKKLIIDNVKLQNFLDKLPFKLTKAQEKVIQEIINDISKPIPANRLVQGEVGSGKTVVAAIIIYLAHLNNLKSILMAPTEILAFQHHATLTKLLEPFGINVGIYTGSKKFDKGKIATSPTAPRNDNAFLPNVIVGTHALLSEKLELNDVGLVVVDEQQRFGVAQRSLLRSKTKSPHFITMTATPIPRTVALTIYGDLDLSVIDEMPVGRLQVRTHFVPEAKREDSYKFLEKTIKEGQQVYIITPLIDESETLLSAKAAKAEFERLQTKIFPKLKLGLLHGKLKPKEKEAIINDFKDHKIDILVSTSVVEVGMDIPNATIMVIEGAERFGLSQLHQLRGRVGRGDIQSFCFLFAEQEVPPVISRLKNLEHIHDGLKLAELDLQTRGSGEIFGTRQSGDWDLKIASLSNLDLIETARNEAKKILQDDLTLDKHQPLLGKLISLENIMPD